MCTMNGQKMREQGKGIDTGSIRFSDAKTAVENSFIRIQEKYQNKATEIMSFSGVHEYNDMTEKIIETEQTGSNCGCFASGMALWSFIKDKASFMESVESKNGEKYKKICEMVESYYKNKMRESTEKPTDDEKNISIISLIIQEIAKENGLSSIGEMFSVSALEESINLCGFTLNNGRQLIAKEADFNTPKELEKIVKQATSQHIRVLFPYQLMVEGDDVGLPDYDGAMEVFKKASSDGKQVARFALDNNFAHWAVIEDVDEKGIYFLYEGNRVLKTDKGERKGTELIDLYYANRALSDGYLWDDYLKENPETKKDLESRLEILKGKNQQDKVFREHGDRWIEKVDLRGKILLIGLKKEG